MRDLEAAYGCALVDRPFRTTSVRHLEAHMARRVVYDGDANTMVNLIDTRDDLKLAAEGGRSTGSGHILRHRLLTHNKYVRARCAHTLAGSTNP